jgi:hypothetical protein
MGGNRSQRHFFSVTADAWVANYCSGKPTKTPITN